MADTIQAELQNLLELFLASEPHNWEALADEFRVSLLTLKRWSEGKNLPHPIMARPVVARLKELLWEPQA